MNSIKLTRDRNEKKKIVCLSKQQNGALDNLASTGIKDDPKIESKTEGWLQ